MSCQHKIHSRFSGCGAEVLLADDVRAKVASLSSRLTQVNYKLAAERLIDGRVRFIIWHGIWGRHFDQLEEVEAFVRDMFLAMAQKRAYAPRWVQQ